jgi:hypothetical protein
MPIVEVGPGKEPKAKATGQAVPVALATAVVQTRNTPRQSLITQISGSVYVIDYFRQNRAANDQVRALALDLDPVYQSYDRISQMETRRQGDLSFSVNDTDKKRTVTGELTMYPGCPVPNEGDMFLADAGQGRRGIFQVTNAIPLSYYMQTCYSIQFSLMDIENADLLANLDLKTDQRYQFIKDFARSGKNPIIIDELYNDYRNLSRVQGTMISEYMRLFFDETSQTLMIPGQERACYDPFLVTAMLGLLETSQHGFVRKLTAHNLDIQYAFRTTTVWDALLQVEPSHIHLACQRLGLTDKTVVQTRAPFGGAYWNHIDEIMYPMEPREDAMIHRVGNIDAITERLDHGPAPVRDFFRLISTKDTSLVEIVEERAPTDMVPNIHNVADDDYYVFSKAFYQQDHANQSLLEKTVWSVLEQNDVDVPTLSSLVNQSKYWDKLERFYFVPVLILLCTLALRGPSSI